MCGRMNITDNEGIRFLMEIVGLSSWPAASPRFNVSPSQSLDVLVRRQPNTSDAAEATSSDGTYQHRQMNWGLVPPWARDGQFKRPLINARSETVREKPSFRHLIGPNRCLVPVTGFYEWHRDGNTKRPFYIYPSKGRAMLFGALYQEVEDDVQVTLLTTAANDEMNKVHHRMPVIIRPDDIGDWMSDDKASGSANEHQKATDSHQKIDSLMAPIDNDWLSMHEVSSYVSNARNTGPECSQPLQESAQRGLDI